MSLRTTNRVTFIGGGSYQWVPVLFRDMAVNPALSDTQFVLHDIDIARNEEIASACRAMAAKLGSAIHVVTENCLDKALQGATAVILCISTGGLEAMSQDIELPKKYGIYQPVGDSTGPGGIVRTLRNIPVVVDLVRRMERHCPNAWLLNLTNPMNQIVRAVQQTSNIRVIGLCHEFKSFMSTAKNVLGLTDWQNNISATIAGINHFSWVKELSYNGTDLLPALRRYALDGTDESSARRLAPAGEAATAPRKDIHPSHTLGGNRVKFQLFNDYGLIPYPGDRHLVEFFPYYLSEKTDRGAAFGVQLTSIDDRRKWMNYFKERLEKWTDADADSIPRGASDEGLAPILAALIAGGPATVQPATLPNTGQIVGLPLGTSVETLATFSNGGLFPHASGSLPAPIHALVAKHSANQDLTVEAALEGDRAKALQAMLADPLNNTNDVREISALLDELLEAHAHLLPQFFPRSASNGAASSVIPAPHRNGHTEAVEAVLSAAG
ncbi:MAG TPA: hypothetical protein VK970_26085 [Candidatus Methylacidiphilales bacterium]|nr:hypothetical protein [Candidatus Methylacidiphilales bacterium]